MSPANLKMVSLKPESREAANLRAGRRQAMKPPEIMAALMAAIVPWPKDLNLLGCLGGLIFVRCVTLVHRRLPRFASMSGCGCPLHGWRLWA